MSYRPMEISLAAANIDRVRTIVKKARQDVKGLIMKAKSFKIIASFPAIKERIDRNNTCDNSEEINKLVGTYQIDGDDAYCFRRDKQYALFNLLFRLPLESSRCSLCRHRSYRVPSFPIY